MNNQPLTIGTLTVRQDDEGRYCLNDLHKAAGGQDKLRPVMWLRRDSTQELLDEVAKGTFSYPLRVSVGSKGGTYATKELVYAYAMWISPAFHLKVIRAYDKLQTQGVAVADHAAEDLLANPMAYMEKVFEQAKVIQAKNKQLEAQKVQLTNQRDVAVNMIAPRGRTLRDISRKLPNVHLNRVTRSLADLGYLYKQWSNPYRVYRRTLVIILNFLNMREMMKYPLIALVVISLTGCASPSGANWAYADFNKYDRNYAEFKTKSLNIGASKADILNSLGSDFTVVEAGKGYEIVAYQQWVSTVGPDHVGKTLYLKFEEKSLSYWKITNDTVAIVPRSW